MRMVLADLDLKLPTVTAYDKVESKATGQVPAAIFEPKSASFSLGQNIIDKFQGDRSWPSPAPDKTYAVMSIKNKILQ